MGLLDGLIGILTPVINSIFPNPEDELKRQQALYAFQQAIIEKQADITLAAASIVQTEAGSKFWLTACWRPILMLLFGGLVCARFFGFNNPNMSPDEYNHLWSLLELGIGGYVGGRSLEKITSTVMGNLPAAKK